jgi:hypothetical protein
LRVGGREPTNGNDPQDAAVVRLRDLAPAEAVRSDLPEFRGDDLGTGREAADIDDAISRRPGSVRVVAFRAGVAGRPSRRWAAALVRRSAVDPRTPRAQAGTST